MGYGLLIFIVLTIVVGGGLTYYMNSQDSLPSPIYESGSRYQKYDLGYNGKNDVWQIDFIDQFPDCEVEVYNRWGEQLFYSKGYAIPFNGQYKGKNLPVGTYYYVVKLNHPNYPKPYTSPLTIFR